MASMFLLVSGEVSFSLEGLKTLEMIASKTSLFLSSYVINTHLLVAYLPIGNHG